MPLPANMGGIRLVLCHSKQQVGQNEPILEKTNKSVRRILMMKVESRGSEPPITESVSGRRMMLRGAGDRVGQPLCVVLPSVLGLSQLKGKGWSKG